MSTEGLKKTVLAKARAEAQLIRQKARAEAEAREAAARQAAEKASAEILEKAKLEAQANRQRAVSAFERELRLQALRDKNRLLEEVLAGAARAFRELDSERLKELYRRELAEIDLKGATLYVPAKARGEFESILKGRTAIKEDPDIDAGYIVALKEYRLDRTLAARLQEINDELRPVLAELLFEAEK